MSDESELIEELEYVLDGWQICEFCNIVDRDRNRSTYGHACSVCGEPSKGGGMYFDTSVYLLIDLIKEAIKSEHKVEYKNTFLEYELNTHYISVLLFFCTLRELLLNILITDLCHMQKIPENIYERLISDNKMHIQKQDKLFKSLTGNKWVTALTEVDKDKNNNYVELNENIKKLVTLRNGFTHKGDTWDINKEIAIDCIAYIPKLINMHVDLNNKYVHKL